MKKKRKFKLYDVAKNKEVIVTTTVTTAAITDERFEEIIQEELEKSYGKCARFYEII